MFRSNNLHIKHGRRLKSSPNKRYSDISDDDDISDIPDTSDNKQREVKKYKTKG
jgi:hypothetical protein